MAGATVAWGGAGSPHGWAGAAAGENSQNPAINMNINVIGSYHFAVLARAEREGCLKALTFADHSIASLKTLLPGQFQAKPGETVTGSWLLMEARATVQRALAAGYGTPLLTEAE